MTDDVNADKVAAARKRDECKHGIALNGPLCWNCGEETRKREAKAAFMREYVLAVVRAGHDFDHIRDLPANLAEAARAAWDAIEAEAQR